MVGMGMPLEQRWILDNYLKIKAKVFWEVGAAFEYWAGRVRRCPQWMGQWGLEWLFRLLLEPRRMAKRYLWGNPVFIFNILRERWKLLKEGERWRQ
jgi:N-acetylglucosaminyldiphosphoundecaprenol N-acetyl-beta-D-mannosaminyltransferase